MPEQERPATESVDVSDAAMAGHEVTASPAAAPPAGETSGGAFVGLRPLVALLGNVTVLTSLLYFFGWRQTATQDSDLRLNQDIFGLSTQDYLLRSVGSVIRLLSVLGVVGLLFVYLDHALRWAVAHYGPRDRIVLIAVRSLDVAWLVVPVVVYLLRLWRPDSSDLYIAYPLALGAGVMLIVYRAQVRRRLGLRTDPTDGRSLLERGAVALLLVVAVFWATSNYADVEGHRLAEGFRTSDLIPVTVFSPQRIDLSGAQEQPISASSTDPAGALYQYRYTGLRLMAHSGGHYFLVPASWTPTSGALVVLSDKDPVRLEFGS
ncbi:MAG TPA: hypothetical protein VGD55_06065 [Acidothermaceae bacterium]